MQAVAEWRRIILVITNSRAGTATAERVDAVMERLGGRAKLSRCAGPAELDATLDLGHDTIVSAGGDGSLHALANALHRRGELGTRTVGLLPMGTGNDFARALGIPLDPVEAADTLLRGIVRPLDLLVDDTGEVTVNALHFGAGADTTREAHRWKRLLGPLSYPMGGLITGWAARGYRLHVEADGATVIGPEHHSLMVALANGANIGAGTAILDPTARADDGTINVVVSRSRGRLARVRYGLHLYRGTHRGADDVHHVHAHTVRVTGRKTLGSIDGEVKEELVGRTWRILPGVWNFLVPKEYLDG
ncbi:YegS/Rv2252/BmrU family lipid kinase [Lipingzhangella halophila]|uniref:YegS/Rv2252/BmrU family lipid kinase n=1 Tax=Lipingzhangella halophila TaxID=1783352 RepID=A0A7W7W3L0_9ACTN|nr:diacylglycerol kinase family protein [Lipingzhangella halophila]MBB4932623.1 YegS/Rv2252/BmrU family lipid kinase [Lipingzhangella halophila]